MDDLDNMNDLSWDRKRSYHLVGSTRWNYDEPIVRTKHRRHFAESDYAQTIIMDQWRQRPEIVAKYGPTVCWMDLDSADRKRFLAEVAAFKKMYPISTKYHNLERQKEAYENAMMESA